MRAHNGGGAHSGARIRAARIRLGWSQTELAAKLAVSQPTIAHWESGAHSPRWALLPRLTALLGITREDLLGLNDDAQGQHKSLVRSIPVFDWPRSECDIDLLVSGKAQPVSYVSLSSPGAAPVAIIMKDPNAADEFPPGSIGLLDLTDRAPKDGAWYLVVEDGSPVTRLWRDTAKPAIWDVEKPFASKDASMEALDRGLVGRIVLSIRPH